MRSVEERETENWGDAGRAVFWNEMLSVYPGVSVSILQIAHITKTTNNCIKNLRQQQHDEEASRSRVWVAHLIKCHFFFVRSKNKIQPGGGHALYFSTLGGILRNYIKSDLIFRGREAQFSRGWCSFNRSGKKNCRISSTDTLFLWSLKKSCNK